MAFRLSPVEREDSGACITSLHGSDVEQDLQPQQGT
jgi:hypothetical protein